MQIRTATCLMWLATTARAFVLPHDGPRPVGRASKGSRTSLKVAWMPPSDFHTLQDTCQTALVGFQHSFPLATSLWQSYTALLQENPLETKTLTAATLSFTGDAVAQLRSVAANPDENYNWKRGLAFLTFGAFYTGAFQSFYFDYLNSHVVDVGENLGVWGHQALTDIPVSIFVRKEEWWQYFDLAEQIENVMGTLQDPPTLAAVAAAKVAFNQFVVIPSVYMPLFFAISGAVGGMDVNQSIARARSLYVPLLQRNYLFWLPMQFVQFYALPSEYQVPFVCVASLCWTVILSSIGGSTSAQQTPVAYVQGDNSADVAVVPVESGVVNELTDNVRLEDVHDALVPQSLRDAVETTKDALAQPGVQSSASGLAVGLLASASDDALIGAAAAQAIGFPAPAVGVAVVSAVGAGVGYLAGTQKDEATVEPTADVVETSAIACDGSSLDDEPSQLEGGVVTTR